MDTTLVTVTPDNCLDKLPRRSGDISDFFLQTRLRIHRCGAPALPSVRAREAARAL